MSFCLKKEKYVVIKGACYSESSKVSYISYPLTRARTFLNWKHVCFYLLTFIPNLRLLAYWLQTLRYKPKNFRLLITQGSNCRFALRKLRRNCKVVNHEENAKQFFPKENLIHPQYIFPHYIQIISTFYLSIAYYYQIIKRNIVCAQNYIAKCKKYFLILK